MSLWVSSGFTRFLPFPQNMTVGGLTILNCPLCECVYMMHCDRLVSHPWCIIWIHCEPDEDNEWVMDFHQTVPLIIRKVKYLPFIDLISSKSMFYITINVMNLNTHHCSEHVCNEVLKKPTCWVYISPDAPLAFCCRQMLAQVLAPVPYLSTGMLLWFHPTFRLKACKSAFIPTKAVVQTRMDVPYGKTTDTKERSSGQLCFQEEDLFSSYEISV